MKKIHFILLSIVMVVSTLSVAFGYNKAKDGTYYGDFNGDGKHDIILYDKTKGTGVIWVWSGKSWKTLWENNTFRKTWKVHLGDFDGNGKTDMFLYDKKSGTGVVLAIDEKSKTGAKNLWKNDTFRKTWDIFPVDVNGDTKIDLFLYDKSKGNGTLFGWDGKSNFKTLWKAETFRKTWNVFTMVK